MMDPCSRRLRSRERANLCVSTFQLAVDEVPDLIDVLRAGLDASYTRALAERRATRLSDAG